MKNLKLNKAVYILIIGAPGVGKGTYSRMLSKDLNLPEFSTGDELRKVSKENSNDEIVNKIKNIMNEGKLVSDEYMLELVKNKLSKDEYKNGVILDGFPRTFNQAKELDNFKQMNLVVKIDLRQDILIKKLLGRRVCNSCGKGYNICEIKDGGYDMDPLLPKKVQGRCDECGDLLIQRTDDNEDTIRSRLAVYEKMSKPVEKFYGDKNLMITLELKRGIKDYPVLFEAVKNKLL
jgi:adenylate kinase